MILVTGGSGFVGLNVVEQLLARGAEVTVFDLRPPAAFASKVRFVEGDVSDDQEVGVEPLPDPRQGAYRRVLALPGRDLCDLGQQPGVVG